MLDPESQSLLSDIADRLEDLTQAVQDAATRKEPEEKPEAIDPNLLEGIRELSEALRASALRENPAPVVHIPAPVVNVAAASVPAPVVNIAPAQITVQPAKPEPKRGFECTITERDHNGHIRKFTIIPV